MDEVTGPVIAIALVLGAVFIPTAFIAGISGQFYRQFALTIAASTIISAFNSLTLSPARARCSSKPHGHGEHARPLPHARHRRARRRCSRRSFRLNATLVEAGPAWPAARRPERRRRSAFMRASRSLPAAPPAGSSAARQPRAQRLLRAFNWSFDWYPRRLWSAPLRRSCDRSSCLRLRRPDRADRRRLHATFPLASSPNRTRVTWSSSPTARRRQPRADRRRGAAAHRDRARRRGVAHMIGVPGYSVLTGTNITERRRHVRHSQAVRGARRPRTCTTEASPPSCARQFRRCWSARSACSARRPLTAWAAPAASSSRCRTAATPDRRPCRSAVQSVARAAAR